MNSNSTNKSDLVKRSKLRRTTGAMSLSCAVLFGMLAVSTAPAAYAAEAKVGLGAAESYSVLAGQTVTNTGASIISNDLGTSPGTSITGFPPGLVAGSMHAADEHASLAKSDLVKAYDDAASRQPTATVQGDLVDRILVGGVYNAPESLELNGAVTLDGQGDPSSVWIFQVGSEFKTGSSSQVRLINGASACNVYWQVGSSATLGTDSDFKGSILALTSISVTTDTVVEGRALARNGEVTLDNNLFLEPDCTASIPEEGQTPVPVPTPTDTPTEAPTPAPSDEPTAAPAPSDTPVPVPSDTPTTVPTDEATVTPTTPPVAEDDRTPTDTPTLPGSNNQPDQDFPNPEWTAPSDVTLQDENEADQELARTGASSTMLFAGVGSALALLGGALLLFGSRTTRTARQH